MKIAKEPQAKLIQKDHVQKTGKFAKVNFKLLYQYINNFFTKIINLK